MLRSQSAITKATGNTRSASVTANGQSIFKHSTVSQAVNQQLSLPRLCALTAVTAMSLNSPVLAQDFPAAIDVSELDGSNGFIISGEGSVFESSNSTVSSAGDINGDGVSDLIIGLPYSDASSLDPTVATDETLNTGAGLIVFGGGDLGATGRLDVTELDGDNGFSIVGVPSDFTSLLGISVSGAGDFNADGTDDLIIGDNRSNRSIVVFGGADVGGTGSLSALTIAEGTNTLKIDGPRDGNYAGDDYAGDSVSGAGDLNGDGIADVIIGAPHADGSSEFRGGSSYVVFGGESVDDSASLDLTALDGTDGFVVNGSGYNTTSGSSVSGAGDFNGDGAQDIIIGAPQLQLGTGESHIVFGGVGVGSTGALELSSLDGQTGFVINGIATRDVAGTSVSDAGDFNGDGVSDVIIGAPYADPNGINGAGQSYIVFGGVGVGDNGTLDLLTLDGTNGFAINGTNDFSDVGFSVSSAGDINGDGISDVIIAARSTGEIHVVFGGVGVGAGGAFDLASLNGTNGFVITTETLFSVGNSVSAAGDVNNDGVSDVIISSFNENDGTFDLAFVIFGMVTASPTPPSTITCNGLPVTVNLTIGQTPTSGDDVIQGTSGADTITALGGSDTICGLGGDDQINAGAGADWVDAGTGNDIVFGISGADVLRGGPGADRVFGGDGEDLINGDGGGDLLDGGSGDDLIFGSGGRDEVLGRDGDDTLFGGSGDDTILGASGSDEINGGEGSDVLNGGIGDDTIDGGEGDDTIEGRAGDDTIEGGAGNDRVSGQSGNDTITDVSGDDELFGNAGDDVITASSGSNLINGGPGNDTLTGGGGDDVIIQRD